MSINITHTMNSSSFENREFLRNAAKDILSRQGASKESMQKIIDQTIMNTKEAPLSSSYNPQLAIIKASSQITLNNSMKETLRYLKAQSPKKQKKEHVLGELWSIVSESEAEYKGELLDLTFDLNEKNFFAA